MKGRRRGQVLLHAVLITILSMTLLCIAALLLIVTATRMLMLPAA